MVAPGREEHCCPDDSTLAQRIQHSRAGLFRSSMSTKALVLISFVRNHRPGAGHVSHGAIVSQLVRHHWHEGDRAQLAARSEDEDDQQASSSSSGRAARAAGESESRSTQAACAPGACVSPRARPGRCFDLARLGSARLGEYITGEIRGVRSGQAFVRHQSAEEGRMRISAMCLLLTTCGAAELVGRSQSVLFRRRTIRTV